MTPEITAVIAIIIGLIFCFAGYKVQKLLITIVWFAIGFVLANKIGANFIEAKNVLLIVQIISGVVFGSLGFKLEKLALCIAVAYLVYTTIGPYITGFEKGVTIIVQFGIAAFIGILSTFFIKPILIVVSSFAGANLLKIYVPSLVTVPANILLIVVIVVAVLGALVQFKNS